VKNPAQFFYGTATTPFRSHCAEAWRTVKPRALYVPCSGRFTEVCAFIAGGAEPKVIHTSDVSLFSSVIGELAAGRSVSRMKINLEVAEPFSQFAKDEVELGAAVLIAAKLADMPVSTIHAASLKRHVVDTAGDQVTAVAKALRTLVDTLHGVHYEQRDIRDEVARYIDELEEEDLVLLAMPTVVGDYTKMLGGGERLFGWRGVEANEIEEQTRAEAHERLLHAKPLVLSVCQFEYLDTAPGWHVIAAVSDRPKRVDYLVANRKAIGRRKLPRRAYTKPEKVKSRRKLPIYDNHELTEDSVVHMEALDEPTALHYRGVFVHRMGMTRARAYYGAFVDGQVFGVFGMNADKVQMGLSSQMFEIFGVCMYSSYSRLSVLLTGLSVSSDAKTMYQSTIGGLTAHEMDSIASQSFMQSSVGKTEHRGKDMVSRKRRPDGTWEIYYRAPLTDLTWKETYDAWLAKHARKRRAA
jgi:hypothetical protein